MREKEKHGMAYSPEYQTWGNMITRCTNPNHEKYPRYGGRGIKVCNRWLYSFTNFYNDMGKRPFPKAQIDRIETNGNYEPSNCEWVTNAYNNQHQTTTKLTMGKAREIRILLNGDKMKQKDIASLYMVSRYTIHNIAINKSWKENR